MTWKKFGPDWTPDREGEHGQAQRAQLARDLDGGAVGHAGSRQGDAREQDGSGSQAHLLELDVANEHAHADE